MSGSILRRLRELPPLPLPLPPALLGCCSGGERACVSYCVAKARQRARGQSGKAGSHLLLLLLWLLPPLLVRYSSCCRRGAGLHGGALAPCGEVAAAQQPCARGPAQAAKLLCQQASIDSSVYIAKVRVSMLLTWKGKTPGRWSASLACRVARARCAPALLHTTTVV